MKPKQSRVTKDAGSTLFGEHDENNKLDGRGIQIWDFSSITIGYWKNGGLSIGNYIIIFGEGKLTINVGELYVKKGYNKHRGIQYKKDGSEREYDSGK